MATLNDTALGGADGSGTTVSCADALNVTAGDLVVAGVKHEGAATTITIDTGAATPTFTDANAHLEAGFDDLGGKVQYWIATSTGTVTVRAVFGAARSFKQIKAYSFTPAGGTTWALGNVAAAAGAGTSPASGNASATVAGCATGFIHAYGSVSLTPGSGWSEAAELNVTSSLVTEYRLVTGAGTLNANGTIGDQEWISQLAIFNEVGGGGGAAPNLFMLMGVGT